MTDQIIEMYKNNELKSEVPVSNHASNKAVFAIIKTVKWVLKLMNNLTSFCIWLFLFICRDF
jgi:hypothetical protein